MSKSLLCVKKKQPCKSLVSVSASDVRGCGFEFRLHLNDVCPDNLVKRIYEKFRNTFIFNNQPNSVKISDALILTQGTGMPYSLDNMAGASWYNHVGCGK